MTARDIDLVTQGRVATGASPPQEFGEHPHERPYNAATRLPVERTWRRCSVTGGRQVTGTVRLFLWATPKPARQTCVGALA